MSARESMSRYKCYWCTYCKYMAEEFVKPAIKCDYCKPKIAPPAAPM
jgi:DNA-directed RNA polymerase subunit RPC12/RpoP